ncbi:MAG: rod shape-determining protein MreC [Rhodospirillaceae bacterium]|nr:rod shape-determining protein MreC [Rhodospirillaceae bacterium]MBT5195415.1 rod shape-determining protein MreC [Rhodospirillaceae bacterium]MBT7756708.1 rod shape-determining protein MreC [Rhodospirillaceae bacterium]
MAKGPRLSTLSKVAAPARGVAQRFGLLLLMSAAVALLVLGKTHDDAIRQLRVMAVEAIAPLLEVLSAPVSSARHAISEIEYFWNTNRQNQDLREQVVRLTKWQTIARNLEQENANLRALLDPAHDPAPMFVSARVIGDTGGLFVQSALLNAGRRDGVEPGQAVTTGLGLAGRVVEVGQRSSRLLLLTDLNSRVPVVVEHSRHRAVLAGDNSSRPRLTFLPANAKVNPGDRVVTSGHAGVFPPGLPVGIISSVTDGEARIQPFVDWVRLEYVTVLRYRAIPAGDMAHKAAADSGAAARTNAAPADPPVAPPEP